MKRACAAIVISASSIVTAFAGELVLPLNARVQLCADDGTNCHVEALGPGESIRAFIDRHSDTTGKYRLSIILPAGQFDLSQTWAIDGATVPARISHLSITGSAPGTRLSGAKALSELGARIRDPRDGVVTIELPRAMRSELEASSRYTAEDPAWPQLLDTQGPLQITRWPRQGWATFTQNESAGAAGEIGPGDDTPLSTWHDESSAWVWGFFKFGWHADYASLKSAETTPARLRIAGRPRYGIGPAGRYQVLNLRSELRAAGEYWIDFAHGQLHARLREAPSPRLRLTVLTTPLVQIRNTRAIRLSNLELADTRGDGLVIENGNGMELSHLTFERIGRDGIVIDGGRNVHLSHSVFENLGDRAIVLRGGDRRTLTASGHRVEDSVIRRPSQRLNTPATAIRLEGVGHVVRGNTITDAPHSAVYFDGNDHTIEANWIERTCLEVDDAGAIYAGRDWTFRGNILKRNVISSLPLRGGRANLNGVYLDDMISGTQVLENLFFDVPRGVLVGGGRDNLIHGNLFVNVSTPILIDQRALEWAHASVRDGGVMRRRLGEVPFRSQPWTMAYPAIASVATERAAIPENNELKANVTIASGVPIIAHHASLYGQIETPISLDAVSAASGSARRFFASCRAAPQCARQLQRMRLRESSAASAESGAP